MNVWSSCANWESVEREAVEGVLGRVGSSLMSERPNGSGVFGSDGLCAGFVVGAGV